MSNIELNQIVENVSTGTDNVDNVKANVKSIQDGLISGKSNDVIDKLRNVIKSVHKLDSETDYKLNLTPMVSHFIDELKKPDPILDETIDNITDKFEIVDKLVDTIIDLKNSIDKIWNSNLNFNTKRSKVDVLFNILTYKMFIYDLKFSDIGLIDSKDSEINLIRTKYLNNETLKSTKNKEIYINEIYCTLATDVNKIINKIGLDYKKLDDDINIAIIDHNLNNLKQMYELLNKLKK